MLSWLGWNPTRTTDSQLCIRCTSWWWAINTPETCRGWWTKYTEDNSASSSSSSVGATARCGLWPVEQYLSIFPYLSPTLSIFSLPVLGSSLSTTSLHPFLGFPLRLVPSSSWVKIFLGILSSSTLSRWPIQLILCPFIHFTIFFFLCSSLLVLDSSYFSIPHFHI